MIIVSLYIMSYFIIAVHKLATCSLHCDLFGLTTLRPGSDRKRFLFVGDGELRPAVLLRSLYVCALL